MSPEPVTRIEIYYAIEHAFADPPVHSENLLAQAATHNARVEVLDCLRTLPTGHLFPRIRDVWEFFPSMPTGAIGGQ